MSTNILMPALSPTMTEGKLSKWLKREGDKVESGQVIAEIETDKATMEVEAADDGVIGKILVEEGTEKVAVNTPIAILLEEGESPDNIKPAASTPVAKLVKIEMPKQDNKAKEVPEKIEGTDGDRVLASPLARRIAKDKGIDINQVKGTGPKGRVIKEDVENFKPGFGNVSKPSTPAAAPVSAPRNSSSVNALAIADAFKMPYEIVPHSMMRKTIASRLLESKQTVPHYYLTIECNLDKVMQLREEINKAAEGQFKLSVNDFIVKASGMAQAKVPNANVAWTDDAMIKYSRADVSVAVSTPSGLITPIVKDVPSKSLKQISEEVKKLAAKAREGKLMPEEYQGGTMTVSNLGMYGIDVFTAILNPPQCAILAVGAGVKKPVVNAKGEIVISTVVTCTASFDHRAIDGALGAEYLAEFKKLIEESPHMLLM